MTLHLRYSVRLKKRPIWFPWTLPSMLFKLNNLCTIISIILIFILLTLLKNYGIIKVVISGNFTSIITLHITLDTNQKQKMKQNWIFLEDYSSPDWNPTYFFEHVGATINFISLYFVLNKIAKQHITFCRDYHQMHG